jgi:TP901 family phage tail tape measure protein
MATLDELQVIISADATQLTAGIAQAEASLVRVGAAAEAASGRYQDAAGKWREANGRFVSSATLAAEAAANVGGSLGTLTTQADRASATINGELVASFRAFDKAVQPLNEGIGRLGTNVQDLGGNLTAYVTAPIAALGAATLKIGGDFDAAFNRVQAATQATGSELDALRQKAQGIALDPKLQFSSIEAAQALENLAKNGLNTTQILNGAADASTSLATATGGTLATAADITTDVMNNFGRSAEQAATLVSSITGATIASKFSIDDYQQALGQAGAVAGQLGVEFEDFNTALSVTSSGFSSGSDAGTSFKTFLQRLVPQTKEAADAMQKLGLNFFDAQGQMLPLRDVAGQLQKAFKGLSDQQKNAIGTQIFGADSIRTALLLAKDGVEGFDRMAASIAKVDAAAQGGILNQGFVGAFEAFKSSLEGLAQAIADSGVLAFATRLAQAGSSIASTLAQVDPAILKFGVGIAAAAAAIGPILFGLGALTAAIPSVVAGLEVMGLASTAALGPLGIGVAAVAAAAALVISHWDEVTAYFGSSGEGGAVFRDLATSIKDSVSVISQAFSSLNGGGGFGELVSASGILKAAFRDIAVGITAVSDVAGGAIGAIVKLLKGDLAGAAKEGQRALYGLVDPLANVLGFTKKGPLVTFDEFFGLRDAIKAADEAALASPLLGGDLGAGLGANVAGQLAAVSQLTKEQQDALAKLRKQLLDNANASRALGDQYDYIGNKSSILSAGIKNLTDAGFVPSGRVVQAYVAQLRQIPEAVELIAGRIAKGLENIGKPGEFKLELPELPALPELLEPDYKGVFSRAAQGVLAGGGILQDSLMSVNNDATAQLAQFQLAGEMFSENIGNVLGAGFTDIATSFGEAIGQIVSGASGLEALPSLVLGALGGLAIQVGQLAIGTGIAVAGIKAALETLNPVVAIAGGIALVALGTAVKGIASNIGKSGGGSSLASAPNSNYSSSTRTTAQQQPIKVVAEFVLRGKDLVAIGKSEDYRSSRTR